ncbi:MAG TPA: acetylglutamate kinase [Candidatus Nanopelagicaceae bacterium]|nr:acetylglutamate kinase [Candidatus Nanopelagicaceae bacterium]
MPTTPPDHTLSAISPVLRARILVEALPYIRRFHGKLLVVKLGGVAMDDPQARDTVLQDLVLLRFVGLRPVLVHGGGREITAMAGALGLETRFIGGLRVTDERTMEVAKMVLTGKITPDLVAAIHRLGGRAMGLSGEDGPTLLVRRQMGPQGEDLGLVGAVEEVNPEPVLAISERGLIPVVASIGLGYDGLSYNVNADTVAAALAAELKAAKLLMLTDVVGVQGRQGELLSELTLAQAEGLLTDGTARDGMIPKLKAACDAARAGVTVHIVDGREPHSILLELLTASGVGTMIDAAPAGAA